MALLTAFWVASFLVLFGAGLLMSRLRPRRRRTVVQKEPHTLPSPRPSA